MPDEQHQAPPAPMQEDTVPEFECPKHGRTTHVLRANIPGHEGTWCMKCWVESFGKHGVSRVTPCAP